MSGFEVGAGHDETRDDPLVHAFVVAGTVGKVELTADAPEAARAMMPVALLALDVMPVCTCGRAGCPGVRAPVEFSLGMGWQGVAATLAMMRAFLEHQPVHIRDQAAALEREQLTEARKAWAAASE